MVRNALQRVDAVRHRVAERAADFFFRPLPLQPMSMFLISCNHACGKMMIGRGEPEPPDACPNCNGPIEVIAYCGTARRD